MTEPASSRCLSALLLVQGYKSEMESWEYTLPCDWPLDHGLIERMTLR